ncbi:MAG: hypothetical protein ACE5FM_09090, partial [Methyloligellaceae bacterium]
MTEKPVQEAISPYVTGLTALFALFVHWRVREFFTKLLAFFLCALFFREWHFWGTDKGFLIAVLALLWWASSRRAEIRYYLSRPSISGLLSGAMWTYLLAMIFDYHIPSFLPGYHDWTDNLEEPLET